MWMKEINVFFIFLVILFYLFIFKAIDQTIIEAEQSLLKFLFCQS